MDTAATPGGTLLRSVVGPTLVGYISGEAFLWAVISIHNQ